MRRKSRWISLAVVGLLLILVGPGTVLLTDTDAEAAWQPKKPVTFVIMAGKGGGADRIARLMQKIVQKHGWSPQPLIPVNKPGGAGAEALRFLKDSHGDPHVILVTLNSFFTTPLRANLGLSYRDFTPIARMAMDTFILWVNSKSPIKNVDGYVKAVKAAGGKWKMGGTGKGQEDSLVTGLLEDAYGIKVTYVPYKGGGKVAKELIGGHVDSTVNNPSEQISWYEAGRSRPLAAFTPERLSQFPNVPTFRELGKEGMVYYMQRSINAPGGIPAGARQWYINLFTKLSNSDEWQTYCKKKALHCTGQLGFLTGDKLGAFFAQEDVKHKKLLKAMGEI
ncbi:MAG: Bug family tripartite tricarboxylate transporter substrate binding protein [Candidatus Methylomirabilales bacterium]